MEYGIIREKNRNLKNQYYTAYCNQDRTKRMETWLGYDWKSTRSENKSRLPIEDGSLAQHKRWTWIGKNSRDILEFPFKLECILSVFL